MKLNPIPRNAGPMLTTSLKAAMRSTLLFLGLDHALIDFLSPTAIGAAMVLTTIIAVAITIPRRQSDPLAPTHLRKR